MTSLNENDAFNDFEACQIIDSIADGSVPFQTGIRELRALGLPISLIERIDFSQDALIARCTLDEQGLWPRYCRD